MSLKAKKALLDKLDRALSVEQAGKSKQLGLLQKGLYFIEIANATIAGENERLLYKKKLVEDDLLNA